MCACEEDTDLPTDIGVVAEASNTVVSSTDFNLAMQKAATKRFEQTVTEPIMAGLGKPSGPTLCDHHEARRNEEGCLRQKGHDEVRGLCQRG